LLQARWFAEIGSDKNTIIMTKNSILITGGCRSGKSNHALSIGNSLPGKKVFIATAQALDEEMNVRIEKHKNDRGSEWKTFEEPRDIIEVVEKKCEEADVLIIDCLTIWLSNLMDAKLDSDQILNESNKLALFLNEINCTVIVITNEVGSGVVPISSMGRAFRDLAGGTNQIFSKIFDEVICMVSGLPLNLKTKKEITQTNSRDPISKYEFTEANKEGLYEAIYKRRDIRQFKADPIPPETIKNILNAAHHAGSVGFMQPWNFIVIDDPEIKNNIYKNFELSNEEASQNYSGARGKLYSSLKLEGIKEAPINICITCDRERTGPHVLGKNSAPDMDIFSSCCAVQNLWLAARAEGLGVGWVSILSIEQLKLDLGIPSHIVPIAYLCVGYTDQFSNIPLLEKVGWANRLPLEKIIYANQWDMPSNRSSTKH
jgi:5,6-dimethylbenzimidazole synthase